MKKLLIFVLILIIFWGIWTFFYFNKNLTLNNSEKILNNTKNTNNLDETWTKEIESIDLYYKTLDYDSIIEKYIIWDYDNFWTQYWKKLSWDIELINCVLNYDKIQNQCQNIKENDNLFFLLWIINKDKKYSEKIKDINLKEVLTQLSIDWFSKVQIEKWLILYWNYKDENKIKSFHLKDSLIEWILLKNLSIETCKKINTVSIFNNILCWLLIQENKIDKQKIENIYKYYFSNLNNVWIFWWKYIDLWNINNNLRIFLINIDKENNLNNHELAPENNTYFYNSWNILFIDYDKFLEQKNYDSLEQLEVISTNDINNIKDKIKSIDKLKIQIIKNNTKKQICSSNIDSWLNETLIERCLSDYKF